MKTAIKSLKILKFTENSKYPPGSGFLSLGKIDKKVGVCESRLSNDESLAKRYNNAHYRSCREEFHNLFLDDCKSIVFCHQPNHNNIIASFISLLEDKLKIPTKEKTLVFPTDNISISAIRVSPFYLNCPMRRQMFTLFLRASLYVNDISEITNYKNIFNRYSLTKNCLPLIETFLDGFVNFNQSCLDIYEDDFHHGVVYQFTDKSKDQVKNLLS